MPIRNLFRASKKARKVLQYDEMPNAFRVQVINIWERLFAQHLILEYSSARIGSVPQFFSEAILKEVGEAHGVLFNANWGHNDFGSLANYFLQLKNIEAVLQVIQIAFSFAEEKMRPFIQPYLQLGCQNIDDAIYVLNQRFQEHDIGYQYQGGEIVKVESEAQDKVHDQKQTGVNRSMKIFISHSSADQSIAEAFVNLIRSSLRVQAKDIRCTSVDGFRLPAGADAAAQLKQEVFESDIFIALLSPVSITSVFVMFELGARWGSGNLLMPVLVRGLTSRDLKPPLSAIHAVTGTEQGQLHQLLGDIANGLKLKLEPVAAYLANLEAFRKAAANP